MGMVKLSHDQPYDSWKYDAKVIINRLNILNTLEIFDVEKLQFKSQVVKYSLCTCIYFEYKANITYKPSWSSPCLPRQRLLWRSAGREIMMNLRRFFYFFFSSQGLSETI